MVLALNGSMVLFGQGLGAAVGGMAIDVAGLPAVGFTAALAALVAVPLALGLPAMAVAAPAQ